MNITQPQLSSPPLVWQFAGNRSTYKPIRRESAGYEYALHAMSGCAVQQRILCNNALYKILCTGKLIFPGSKPMIRHFHIPHIVKQVRAETAGLEDSHWLTELQAGCDVSPNPGYCRSR